MGSSPHDRVGASRRTGGVGRLPMRVDLITHRSRRLAIAEARSPEPRPGSTSRAPPVAWWVDERLKHVQLRLLQGKSGLAHRIEPSSRPAGRTAGQAKGHRRAGPPSVRVDCQLTVYQLVAQSTPMCDSLSTQTQRIDLRRQSDALRISCPSYETAKKGYDMECMARANPLGGRKGPQRSPRRERSVHGPPRAAESGDRRRRLHQVIPDPATP